MTGTHLNGTNKYHNKKTQVDGYIFASLKEAARYRELKLLLTAGVIRDLELQPPYDITVCGRFIAKYLADFRYVEVATGNMHVEDCKGYATPTYRLKKKLVEALYGITITET